MQSKSLKYLINLCLSAVMAALYVVLDFEATQFSLVLFGNSMKVSLSGFPVVLIAVLCGPVWGMLVGLVGAFIGQLLSYGITATTLLWILPAAVRGLSMGLLFIAFRRSRRLPILCFEVVISSLLVTALNTLTLLIDSKIYGYYSYAVVYGGLITRIIVGVLTAIVFSLILFPVLKAVEKHMK